MTEACERRFVVAKTVFHLWTTSQPLTVPEEAPQEHRVREHFGPHQEMRTKTECVGARGLCPGCDRLELGPPWTAGTLDSF